MHEDVLTAFAGYKAIALAAVEPLDRADDALRHCICLLISKSLKKWLLGALFVPSEPPKAKTKQPRGWAIVLLPTRTYSHPTDRDYITRQESASSGIFW